MLEKRPLRTNRCAVRSGTHSRFLAVYIDNRDIHATRDEVTIGVVRNRSMLVQDALEVLDASYEVLAHVDDGLRDRNEAQLKILGDRDLYNLTELPFTGRVFFYSDERLSEDERAEILTHGRVRGLSPVIRDRSYLDELLSWERRALFISHDSRDKETIAEPLARELQKKYRLSVWLDKYALRVGDSLRDSIERGIKECKACVVVLSPHFLSNQGWTKKEFDSVFTRELIENGVFMFPVWAGVTPRDVYEYSPALADRKGVRWDVGVEKVAWEIHRALPDGVTTPVP